MLLNVVRKCYCQKSEHTNISNMRDDDRKEMERIHSGVVNSMNDGKVFSEHHTQQKERGSENLRVQTIVTRVGIRV